MIMHTNLTRYDAKARSLKLYVNGVEEANTGAQAARAADLTHVKFGCWNGRERMWKGAMDDVRIYSRALTPVEIAGLAGTKAAGK